MSSSSPATEKRKRGRPKTLVATPVENVSRDDENTKKNQKKDDETPVSEQKQDMSFPVRSGSRRSTITGNEISPLYSEIRKTEESVVDIKIDDIKRQHELERTQLQAKIDRLEDQLNINVRLLSIEKDTRESQTKALKGLLNKAKAEAAALKVKVENLEELKVDYKQYRKTHPHKSVAGGTEKTIEKDAEDLRLEFNEEKSELEVKHAKQIEDLQADFAQQMASAEQHFQHRLEEEQNKLMLESQTELEKLAKVKDQELEIFKESQERKHRRTSQFVSTVEYEKLKEEFEQLSKQVEREKVSSAVKSRFASPNTKSALVAANEAKQLRTELTELRKELDKKSNAINKAQVELDKLRNQIQTSKSVTETKMTLLKNKIKGLEAQLARKTELRTPGGTNPLTPVAGGSGPGTRFHRLGEPGTATKRGSLSATSTPILKFSDFSTSPFLRTGGVGGVTGTPVPSNSRCSPVITSSRSSTPVSKLVTPSKRPLATPRSQIPRPTGMKAGPMSIRKLPGSSSIVRSRTRKISLFDDDDEESEENGILDGSKTERRRKRKLNSIAVDIYDTNDITNTPSKQGATNSQKDENDPDHPDTPGSAFKRVKLSTPNIKQTISSTFKIQQKRGGDPVAVHTSKSVEKTLATTTSSNKKRVAGASVSTKESADSTGKSTKADNSGADPTSAKGKLPLKKKISPLRARNRVNHGSFKV